MTGLTRNGRTKTTGTVLVSCLFSFALHNPAHGGVMESHICCDLPPQKARPAATIMTTVEKGFNACVAALMIACVCPSTQSAAICEIGGFLLIHRLRRLPQIRKYESLWLTTLYLKAKHQKQVVTHYAAICCRKKAGRILGLERLTHQA